MISLDWVKDYVDISDQDLHELAEKVTKAGVNIEKIVDNRINNLVIGEVVSCDSHPDSDHLNVCMVNIGDKVVQIVCGASNVRAGIKVLVALPGCVLPNGVTIKKGVIRGQESNGMICALFELGLEEKTKENYDRGIEILDTDLKAGTDANIYLGTNDTLYELDVHKHRNNDCYYHIGFAYEIASILGRKVTLPVSDYNEISDSVKNHIKIDVVTKKCPYYTAKMVKGVKIKESPDFIKRRLIAAGMRPINNVVDISNYVMLEYGQPLHFFDKNKIGDNILVRDASLGEEIVTLDGTTRKLTSSDVVITDGNVPIAIAGVMGGENTEVDSDTKDILIEAAIFDSVSIRYTASRLNLRSEASIRYGKGLSFEYTDKALDRACYLLAKYADAIILSDVIKYDVIDRTPKVVSFNTKEVSTLLGLSLTNSDVKTELERLMFDYEMNGDTFVVTIPYRRLDIDPNVNDIAEEIGRLYGYENLTSTLPRVETKRGMYLKDIGLRKSVSKRLRTLGLDEVKTYTLTSPVMAKLFRYENKENIFLPNPMSVDKSVIRTSILPSLSNVYDYNKKRHVNDISIYEIAKTYDKNYVEESKIAMLVSGNYIVNKWHTTIKCDFYHLKGIIQNLLDYLGFAGRYYFTQEEVCDMHPGMCARIFIDRDEIGVIGRIHPSVNKDEIYLAELSLTKIYNKKAKALKYKSASKYPDIVKDVAFILDKDVLSSDVEREIKKCGSKILTEVSVFDVYVGDKIESSKKSIAYSLTFNDYDRTLTEEEVDILFRKIIDKVKSKFNCDIRDK